MIAQLSMGRLKPIAILYLLKGIIKKLDSP